MATKEEMEGAYDKAKGSVKEAVGDATDNPRLKTEGAWDRTKGAAKQAIGGVKRDLSNAAEDAADAATGEPTPRRRA